jgi:hypothetical protein
MLAGCLILAVFDATNAHMDPKRVASHHNIGLHPAPSDNEVAGVRLLLTSFEKSASDP